MKFKIGIALNLPIPSLRIQPPLTRSRYYVRNARRDYTRITPIEITTRSGLFFIAGFQCHAITRYSACPSLGFVGYSVLELSTKMFHANLQSTVWKRHAGAHAEGHQHGGRKSIKTSGIHFCYKRWSIHPHEQVNIHTNTSQKTSTVQIVKNHRMRLFLSIRDSLIAAILMSCGVKL